MVDNLNLSALDAAYGDEQRGQPPYDPRMMTKVLVYGYCVGVFSSRRIERRLAEDVGFRVLAAGNLPNFRTIADFRKLHLATLAGLFEEVLKIALEAGALKLIFPDTGPDTAFDLLDSRACPRGVTLQAYRPTGRPQHAAATAD